MHDATLPANVRLGPNSLITGDYLTRDRAFRLFRSRLDPGLVIGASCTMDGVMFNVGPEARIEIGDHCYFQEATLISDLEIRIGCRVVIGWHATVIDADFHPSDAAARMAAWGSGKLLSLAQGEADLDALHEIAFAKPTGMAYGDLYTMTAQFTARAGVALWRRMMVLGPPPEFCLVARSSVHLPAQFTPEPRTRRQI